MNFNNAEFYTSFGTKKQLPWSDRAEIVFSGRSNVGKSSLINKLLNRKGLARVSSMPGKTATINFFTLENIYLVDLPGYGFAKVSKGEKRRWAELIEGYLDDETRQIELVIQLVDMRHSPTQDDIHMINYLIDNEIPFVIALTKSDKLTNNQRKERLEKLLEEIPYGDQVTMIPFSAVNGEGVEEIQNIITDIALAEQNSEDSEDTIDDVIKRISENDSDNTAENTFEE